MDIHTTRAVLRKIRRLFQYLVHRRRVEAELDEELRGAFEILVDRYLARGFSPAQARRAAQLEFEGVEQVKERVRDHLLGSGIDTVLQDLRYAWRGLRKQRSFSTIALITLALGIGVNTAVFSVFYAVLMCPLPYQDPDRLVLIWVNLKTRGTVQISANGGIFSEVERRQRSMTGVAGIWVTPPSTFPGDPPVQVKSAFVTTNFFDVLGVPAAIGRTFVASDLGQAATVLADTFWRQHFGADRTLVGRAKPGDGTLIGVLPASFQLHFAPAANVPGDVQVFHTWGGGALEQEPNTIIRMVARLRPGLTIADAQRDLDRIATDMRADRPEFARENGRFAVVGMQADAFRDVAPALTVLFAGGGFVLLICCVNVAGLVLARGNDRRREIAFRMALGASRARIVRLFVAEALTLSIVGGAAGVAAGWVVFRGLLAIRPERLARIDEPNLLWSALGYAAAASLAATLAFALTAALQNLRVRDIEALRAKGQGWLGRLQRHAGRALVVGEITVGFVLVTGASLAARTLFNVERIRPGFDQEQLLAFQLPGMPPSRLAQWEERFASVAGVTRAGAISHLPFDSTLPNWFGDFFVTKGAERSSFTADSRAVTPGYLPAIGARIVEGRHFTAQDNERFPYVVIVDDLLARTVWPGESALGKTIDAQHMTRRGTPFEFVPSVIVGIVEHVHTHSLTNETRPQIYSPFAQNTRERFPQTFVLRTTVPPLSLLPDVRATLQALDPAMAMDKVLPMSAYVNREVAPVGFTAALAALFGALALLLAATGIFGLLNYQVSRRMGEIGMRMAMGATTGDILRLVLREGVALVVAGVLLGLFGALAAGTGLGSVLYGVSSTDPVSFGLALLLLPAAAFLGCWRPARRAASANPSQLLRAE
jgi:putative ABC transport system permease protein